VKRLLLVFFIMPALLSSMLFAQEKDTQKSKLGLTFPNIGMIWHITNDVAFMTGISFNHNWSSTSDIGEDSSNLLSADASLRFYIQEWKGVRFYLAPKYSFSWSNSEVEINNELIPLGSIYTNDSHSHRVSGAWGLQYAISDRISIWGDIGAYYNYRTASISPPSSLGRESSYNSIGIGGEWGLILYLK
jgi:hypothetical protein